MSATSFTRYSRRRRPAAPAAVWYGASRKVSLHKPGRQVVEARYLADFLYLQLFNARWHTLSTPRRGWRAWPRQTRAFRFDFRLYCRRSLNRPGHQPFTSNTTGCHVSPSRPPRLGGLQCLGEGLLDSGEGFRDGYVRRSEAALDKGAYRLENDAASQGDGGGGGAGGLRNLEIGKRELKDILEVSVWRGGFSTLTMLDVPHTCIQKIPLQTNK